MRLISNISSIAGIIGFLASYFARYEPTLIISMILFLTSSIILLAFEIKNRPRKFKNTDTIAINKYMLNWISNTGRVVIFTRDMSWASSIDIERKLIEKAKADELIICMPKNNQFTQMLASNGANIVEYRNLAYTPQSRFTIIHHGRADARIAIGKTFEDYHVIEQLRNDDHPLFYVAQDLVSILINAKQNGIQL